MKSLLSSGKILATSVLAVAVCGAPVQAQEIPLTQEPIFLASRIKPNFILAIDDSGSMDFETSALSNDGSFWWNVGRQSFYGLDLAGNAVTGREVPNFNGPGNGTDAAWKKYAYLFPSGTGTDGKALGDSTNDHFAIPPTPAFAFSRSPDYNAAYFDPTVKYDPWVQFNGVNFAQIVATNAPADPSRGNVRFDLTQPIARTGGGFEFMFHRGMVIPQGTWYRVSGCSNGGTNPTNTNDDALAPGAAGTAGFRVASVNRTVTGTTDGRARCSIAIGYYAPTFYLVDTGGRASAVAAAIGYRETAIDRTARSPGDAAGNGRQVLARFEIRAANFATADQYTAAINNFANWFSYYRKRHQAARAGLSQSFTGIDFVNTGYFTINSLVNVTMRDLALPTDRQALYNQFFALGPNGGTPNKEAINHLGAQFRRTGTTAPIRLACQKNFGMLFTDGFSNPSTPTSYGNVDGPFPAPFRDTVSDTAADIAMRHYLDNLRPDLPEGKVPVSNLCNTPTPDPWLDCRKDPHMNFYAVTLGSRGVLYDPEANQDPFVNPPVWPTNFPARHPSAVDDLWHATINARGKMLNARTPKEITEAIRAVLTAVQDSAVPAGRDSASGARVTADSFFVIPSFAVKFNGTDWSGSLIAYRLNKDGSIGTPLWGSTPSEGDAAVLMPTPANRRLFYTQSAGTGGSLSVRDFSASNLGTSDTAQYTKLGLTAADLAIYPGITPTSAVNYLRGDRTFEQQFSASGVLEGGVFRRRSTVLGSIVNSIPVIFTGKENFGYSTLPGSAGSSYKTFVSGRKDQEPVIYVGANAGFLHAFSGKTGTEMWGFAPEGSLGNMGQLLNPKYQHRYFVDGMITVSDAQRNGSWGTFLVGGSGAGGKNLFAMDVTNPGSVTASSVLWELTSAQNADVGNIFGRPLILPVRGTSGPRWVVLTGNGYNSPNLRPALLVIDLITGQVLATLKPSSGTAAGNGLGNIVAIGDSAGYVSTVYGGDLAGNVWKFNLAGSNPATWSVMLGGAPLYTARDSAGNPQPITGGFDVTRGPDNGLLVFFGTGRYIATTDNQITSTSQRQSLYAILDRGATLGGGRTRLASRSIVAVTAGGELRTRSVSSDVVDFTTQIGWVLDLIVGTDMRGEMFIGFPRVDGGVAYFSTFEPIGDSCTPGGVNWLYGLDTLTGSSSLSNLRIPGNDVDGDGNPDSICTGSACGAVETGSGAPVPEPVVLVPEVPCVPGMEGCPIINSCEANPGAEGCINPPDQSQIHQQCVKIISVGGRQIVQPRPCGRQSWRQVQ